MKRFRTERREGALFRERSLFFMIFTDNKKIAKCFLFICLTEYEFMLYN